MIKSEIFREFLKYVFWGACYFLNSCVLAADVPSSLDNFVIDLKPIVVSAVRSAVTLGVMADDMVIFSKNKIKGMPVHDLGELLTHAPGVSMSVGGFMGQATSLSIHGSNSRDVLVMVDDIPFNTQLSGQANPTRIPLENVDRVEIIKGGSSSAWGSGLGGIVNVITKDVGEDAIPRGSVTNSFASYATRKHAMDLAGKAGLVGYYFMGSFMDTEGARFQSPVKEEKTFGKLSLPLTDELKATGSFGYSGADVRQHVFTTNRINETPYTARYGKLRFDWDRAESNVNAAYKYNNQELSSDTYNALTGARVSASANQNRYQAISLNGHTRLREDDLWVMGVDVEQSMIKSTNYLAKARSVNALAPYSNYTFRLNRFDLTPGVRFDHNNRFGQQLSPSFGSVYHVSRENDTAIRFKVSKAFTAPALMWIYNNDPSVLVAPNFDLRAERAFVYETGFVADMGRVRTDVGVYRSDVKDGLSTVYNSVLGAYQKQNIGKIRRQGVDGKLDYKICEALRVNVFGGYNHPVNRATKQVVRGNGVAFQSFGAGLSYQIKNGFAANLYAHYDRWDSSPSQANDRKPIFDLKLTKDWKSVYRHLDLSCFFGIMNLTNSKYWSDPSLPLPGRLFESGVTVSF